MPGMFITVEGPEGGGKSTQVARLAAYLQGRGFDVLCTREPGGTLTGEAIRQILQHNGAGEPLVPETEALLFAASRAQLVRRVIVPALASGRIVLSDRFADSTTAYQGYGRGFRIEDMLAINAFAIDGARPELTLLLDVEVGLGFERLNARNAVRKTTRDRIESEAVEFHERVRAGYLELALREPDRFRVIDARGDVDRVFEAIRVAVDARLAQRNHVSAERRAL